MKGQLVCETHGGRAPQNRAAAERRLELAAAQQTVAKLNLRREINPHVALLNEVYRAAGVVAWLDDKIQTLPEADMVWGVTGEVTKDLGEHMGTDTTWAAELNTWIKWWQTERVNLAKVAKMALDAGVEERRVRLAEQQGTMLASVIQAILADLHLSVEQQSLVGEVVPRHLRAVA